MTRIAIPIIDTLLSKKFEDCSFYQIYSINSGKLQAEPIVVNAQNLSLNLPEWIKEWEITDVIANFYKLFF